MVSMKEQFQLFAEYNRLMNVRLYDATSQLSDTDLRRDRGAFFKSVLGTLNHILVGDIIWLKRFSKHPSSDVALGPIATIDRPNALDAVLFSDLAPLREQRIIVDAVIVEWIASLVERDLQDSITYESMAGVRFSKPFASLISHLFLHQVHHRGQVTTLLSQLGVDFGETDLVEIIGEHNSAINSDA